MNAPLRDLGKRVEAVPAPQLDVTALVTAGESRIRRRRLAAVAAVTAAVVAVVGGAVLVSPGTRRIAPAPARPDQKDTDPDTVRTDPATRKLTYAVGTVIHWGDQTVDVRPQANWSPGWGKLVDYVDATDDGAVFRHRPSPRPGRR